MVICEKPLHFQVANIFFPLSSYVYIVICDCDLLQEVDPTVENEEVGGAEGMDSLVSELANAIPGIDEAMSFAEMLK